MNFDILRQKILEKAIRGELVPQLESEPEVPQIGKAPEEVPFALPRKWKWIQLENLFLFIDYRGKTPTKSECGIRLITASNVKKGYIDHQRVEYISLSEYESRQSRGISKKGDILFTTEAPLGNAALADLDTYSAGQRVITLRSSNNLMLHEFAVYEILSSFFQKILKDNATGTTAKGIKAARLKKLWIPVPPLEEQARIGAKIRLLFGQMDYAEKAYRELSGPLSERFRQLCLEKAIQGKLVPQLESEPAVEQIGKAPEDVPFAIPEKWKWAHLSQAGSFVGGYTPKEAELSDKGEIPYFKVSDMNRPGNEQELANTEKYLIKKPKRVFLPGTIVYPKNGGAVFTNKRRLLKLESVIDLNTGGYVPGENLIPEYTFEFFKGLDFQKISKGTALPTIDQEKLRLTLIPIPPLLEQRRIVAKLNELLDSVRQLKHSVSPP